MDSSAPPQVDVVLADVFPNLQARFHCLYSAAQTWSPATTISGRHTMVLDRKVAEDAVVLTAWLCGMSADAVCALKAPQSCVDRFMPARDGGVDRACAVVVSGATVTSSEAGPTAVAGGGGGGGKQMPTHHSKEGTTMVGGKPGAPRR